MRCDEIIKVSDNLCHQLYFCGCVGKGPSLNSNPNREKLVSCISTLCLFTKAEPSLTIQHAAFLEPYLRMDWQVKWMSERLLLLKMKTIMLSSRWKRKCISCFWYDTILSDCVFSPYFSSLQVAGSCEVFCQVSQILQLVMPLVDHPSESFLANIEEQLVEVVFSAPQEVSYTVSFDLECFNDVDISTWIAHISVRNRVKVFTQRMRPFLLLLRVTCRHCNHHTAC